MLFPPGSAFRVQYLKKWGFDILHYCFYWVKVYPWYNATITPTEHRQEVMTLWRRVVLFHTMRHIFLKSSDFCSGYKTVLTLCENNTCVALMSYPWLLFAAFDSLVGSLEASIILRMLLFSWLCYLCSTIVLRDWNFETIGSGKWLDSERKRLFFSSTRTSWSYICDGNVSGTI